MTIRVRITELGDYVGKELGVSEWYEITQERIDAFAVATGDDQWIHLDQERSRSESPFGTTIAHGYFTLSLASRFMVEILEITDAEFLVNPGIERFRLRAPVPCGARIRMHASLKRMRVMPNGSARATMSVSFEIEGEKKRCAFGDVNLYYVASNDDGTESG